MSPASQGAQSSSFILPIACADIADVFLHTFGINYAGSALYIVFFSSVTVWTALVRKVWLKRRLAPLQWLAVVFITVSLSVTGVFHGSTGDEPGAQLAFGIFMTLGAAVCDAFMYVLTERALEPGRAGPTPNEISTAVGAINLGVSLAYVCTYSAAGQWRPWVSDRIAAKGGNPRVVAGWWVAQAVVMWAHYLAFYYSVGCTSAVAAAVNKAVQSAGIFLLSAALYCNTSWGLGKAYPAVFVYDEKECLTPMRVVAIVVVCASVLLYALGYRQLLQEKQAAGQVGRERPEEVRQTLLANARRHAETACT